jgi:integrase
MNSKIGGPGWDRTNDQPIMSAHPRVVMETLGHSQISLTMNTYSHVIPALQREAADRMEAVLAAPA